MEQRGARWVTRGEFKSYILYNIKARLGKNCDNSWIWLKESRFRMLYCACYCVKVTVASSYDLQQLVLPRYAIWKKYTCVLFACFFSSASLSIGLLANRADIQRDGSCLSEQVNSLTFSTLRKSLTPLLQSKSPWVKPSCIYNRWYDSILSIVFDK